MSSQFDHDDDGHPPTNMLGGEVVQSIGDKHFEPIQVQDYDPQIRHHLEELNRYSTKINQLEKCFEDENRQFQKILGESSSKLQLLMKQSGRRSVKEARPYYDALENIKILQEECQVAAIKFEKYHEVYLNTKQVISDTELMFHKEMKRSLCKSDNFDHIWQEKLNAANTMVMEAKEKSKFYEDKHMSVMTKYLEQQRLLSQLKSKHSNCIRRSKPYFDEAAIINSELKSIKENIVKLEQELCENKKLYSQALRSLENISEEMHEKRAQMLTKSLKREPGVGAELTSLPSPECNGTQLDCSLVPKNLTIPQTSDDQTDSCSVVSNLTESS